VSCPLDAEAVIGVGQNLVPELVHSRRGEFSVDLPQHAVTARSGNQLAGIVDDDRPAGSSDLE
jgi:hypothetical protein